jgi:hypothetical protein
VAFSLFLWYHVAILKKEALPMPNPTQFQTPPAQYRGKPFWSWNGQLKKQELLRQIDVIRQMGFGGFFMHSRVGLKTEYLGEEWFSLIAACAQKAEELGLEAWVYDEDRWPSGTAGGKVTERYENRMKFILMHIGEPPAEGASPIARFDLELSGLSYTKQRRLSPGEQAEHTLVWFEEVPFPESDAYNGNTYANTMRLETTEDYLTSTHRKYQSHLKEPLSDQIRGFFTDERHVRRLCRPHDGRSVPAVSKNLGNLPDRCPAGAVFKQGG